MYIMRVARLKIAIVVYRSVFAERIVATAPMVRIRGMDCSELAIVLSVCCAIYGCICYDN